MHINEYSEADLQDRLIQFFGKWFDVYFEVTSLCGKFRIDLLMYHNSDTQRNYPIGIEIKKNSIKRGTDIGKWCQQAGNYTKVLFDEKYATVFTAPQISGSYLEEGKLMAKHDVYAHGYLGAHHNINSFLYKSFGIGELQKFKSVWPRPAERARLVINCKEIWSSQYPTTLRTDIISNL